ncbi:MAG TPA: hypothetical protein EYH14_02060 [Euryarchaeota archaeon]|nr:hypothetical protein [Euryarchaeota archaeon]
MPPLYTVKLVEVSFEVGNKIGGIHTVLASKSRLMVSLFEPYLAVGYYDPRKSPREFVEEEPPETLAPAIDAVKALGAEVHYGSWLVPGRPKAVLINPGGLFERTNEIKYYYWDWYRIDSLRSDDWFNVPAVWSYAAGAFLQHLLSTDPDAVSLFHEWLSGGALLYLRKHAPSVPTVFHTHATVLGRVLANSGYDLYSLIDSRSENPDELAYRHVVEAKHLMEKAAAQNAHVFTTVSDVTARESGYVLGRDPDYVLPNGLDMQLVPPMEELSVLHVENEKKINEFVLGYFSPYCNIDVDNTLYFFFSGRYDIHVKGIDVLIDALALLNDSLKRNQSSRNLVFFFFVAREGYRVNPEVLENLSTFRAIADYINSYVPSLRDRLIKAVASGESPDKHVFDESFTYDIRRLIITLKQRSGGCAPLSTHAVPPDDFVVRRLREVGLNNAPDDPVKVIYYPAYLSPGDGLLGLSYFGMLTGTHLGVFPSYYEPWGYTPLETAAWGVPAITTDVSGFGQFILREYGELARRSAISVLPRRGIPDAEFARYLADALYWVLTMPRHERLERKIEAKYMAKKADWNAIIHSYVTAAECALRRARSP